MVQSVREKLLIGSAMAAMVAVGAQLAEVAVVHGEFSAVCRDADGNIRWSDEFHNTVVTTGKNLILDQALAGSAYTAALYLGLISSTSYSSISAADTMSSHAGWLEAGNANAPAYTAPRKTMVFSAASAGAKALSAGLVYAITSGGTIKGGFVVGGSGALSTIDNTAGTLISAGLFSGGDRAVLSGDTVTVSYSMSL